jgi:tetratricopeptide (TPR) repeat protein
MRSGWLRLVLLWLCLTGSAWAQVDLVDPDVPAVRKEKKPVDAEEKEPLEQVDGDLPVKKDPVVPLARPDAGARPGLAGKKPEAKKPPEPPPEVKVAAIPLPVTKANDADLEAAWDQWKTANASTDLKAEALARKELLRLKVEIGASNLESMAQGMLRAAMAHEAAGDSAGAIDLGLAAVELAPDVPTSHLGLAKVYTAVEPSGLGRILEALKTAVQKSITDPRYFRPVLGDFAAALLTALTALAVAVVVVLFARRARYFFYDFHFLFPKALARWQSAAVAILILLLPIVFRMGVAPALLAGFAAVVLYLTTAERIVAAVLVTMLGLMPLLGAFVVHHTAFAGTPAETAYLLEHGGAGAEQLAQQFARKAAEDKASFAELFALGRFELRRGKLDLAIPRLKAALLKKPNEARAELNLGVAMLLNGDLENPKGLFENTARAEPTLAEPLFDLARLYQRRGATLGRDVMAAEIDRANSAMSQARIRNPAIGDAKDPQPGEKLVANKFLLSLPLSRDELLTLASLPEAEERVRSQLSRSLLGDLPETAAPFFPAAGALALLALGFLSVALEASRPCVKCGAPVSRRGDREIPKGSSMCTQCVNVFARKGVVPPSLKVRKQLEVTRYETRMERLSYALGLACSGMGHVFSGLVVRGTIYGFVFLLVIVLFVQRHGVLRAPYESAPLVLRMAPLGLVFVLVYLLSLRGLYRRQG